MIAYESEAMPNNFCRPGLSAKHAARLGKISLVLSLRLFMEWV
jgi:hypothetical protein